MRSIDCYAMSLRTNCTHLGIQLQRTIFLSDFNQIQICSAGFRLVTNTKFHDIRPAGLRWYLHTDGPKTRLITWTCLCRSKYSILRSVSLYSCLSYPECKSHFFCRDVISACLVLSHLSTLSHKQEDFRKKMGHEIRPMWRKSFLADGRADTQTLTIAYRNFANVPETLITKQGVPETQNLK
jgi:hypothetical protein